MSNFNSEVSALPLNKKNVDFEDSYHVRKNFKDIFGVYFLTSLCFDGNYDMPKIGNFEKLDCIDYLALYSDVKDYNKTENTCVCFYQYDHVFDGKNNLYAK